MQRAVVVGLTLTCVCLVFALSGPSAQRIAPQPSAPVTRPAQVEVTNFPAVQQVTGTVSITNLPAAAPVLAFKGYTAATFAETYPGVLALNRTCNSEFPGSRLCSAREILNFIPPPDAPSAAGFLVSYPISAPAVASAEGVLQSRCMRADGVNFDCGDSAPTHPIACCGY